MRLNSHHWRDPGARRFFQGSRFTPRRAAAWAAAVALIVALLLALLPNVAAAQSAPANPPPASTPEKTPPAADRASEQAREGAQEAKEKAREAKEVAQEKAGDWGDKIKATSLRLIDTTKEVVARLAEKIPGTDAHSRAKDASSSTERSPPASRADGAGTARP